MKIVQIYTDGSASKNNQLDYFIGGYGAVFLYGKHKKEIISDCYYNTTSQRMEIMAVIESLSLIKKKGFHIVIFSDSKYVVNTIEKWLSGWIEKGMLKNKANSDLWEKFYEVYNKLGGNTFITAKWIKSHNGHKYNERADTLAKKGACSSNIIYDKF